MRMDTIVEAVRTDLFDRSKRGQEKYGTTLDRQDLDAVEWAHHLYEELLDAALYVRRLMLEIEKLTPPEKVPCAEIASDIVGLPHIRALDLSWEQRLELHGAVQGVIGKSLGKTV